MQKTTPLKTLLSAVFLPLILIPPFSGFALARPNTYVLEKGMEVPNKESYLVECYALGLYGYPKDLKKANSLNEKLVALGERNAIERKIRGSFFGLYSSEPDMGSPITNYGYPQDLKIAVALNDILVAQDDSNALRRRLQKALKRPGIFVSILRLRDSQMAAMAIPKIQRQR